MPHPENHVETAVSTTDGRRLFAGLVAHFAQAMASKLNLCGSHHCFKGRTAWLAAVRSIVEPPCRSLCFLVFPMALVILW